MGKNEIYHRENLVGSFLVHKSLGPNPPPPPPRSNTSLPPLPPPNRHNGIDEEVSLLP